MDHLILPENPIHDPIEVPILSMENYDGGDFATYPDRQGWGPRTLAEWQEIFRRPPPVLTAFLQRWLYFGFLEVVLQERINISDFIRPGGDPNNPILTTKRLPALVQRRSDLTKLSREIALNIVSTLWDAGRLHRELASSRGGRINNGDLHYKDSLTNFIRKGILQDPRGLKIAMSTALMMEFVQSHITQRSAKSLSPAWTSLPWIRLREDGWCPSKLLAMYHQFNVSGFLFMNNLTRQNLKEHHRMIRIKQDSNAIEGVMPQLTQSSLCTPQRCSFRQVSDATYQTRHTDECSGCFDVVADPNELSTILKRGNIPLILSIDSGDESHNIQLVEAGHDIAYVAISHVWSDGLGNVQRNSLPRCQLLRLSNLIRSLPGNASNIILFWIDTICVPPSAVDQGEPKKLALQMMRRTYEDAAVVLVLDAWLLSDASTRKSDVENLMRIFNSLWNSRLWTYQEGVLAKSLYFQLKDAAYELDSGMNRLNSAHYNFVLAVTLRPSLNERHVSLRGFRRFGLSLEEKIVAISQALEFRSTSVASDEALCLASLLDLDVGQIIQTEPALRMQKFWRMLPRVPTSLLEFEGATLPTVGLRWAPRTLLLSKLKDSSNTKGYALEKSVRSVTAEPTSRGLLVRFPALIFRTMQCPIGGHFFVRDESSKWFAIYFTITESKDTVPYLHEENETSHSINPGLLYGTTEVAFIIPDIAPTPDQRIDPQILDTTGGILAAIHEEVNGVIYAKKLCNALRVWLSPALDSDSETIEVLNQRYARWPASHHSALLGTDPRNGILSSTVAKTIPSTQVWCID